MSPPDTTFVGRVAELAQIRAWLEEGRVTTIVGPAGIGKSRLASEAATTWAGEVHFVDLSHETQLDTCVSLVARALGLVPTASANDVGHALAAREAPLLLLDDADAVLGPMADLISDWRAAAPGVRILTTSRERLRIRAESTINLGPLSCAGGADSEAARLFADRVAHQQGSAPLDAEELTSWCTWLDGVPLALELAAARAPFLGEFTGQSRLDLLRDGYRDGHERHTTLRRAIEWSWAMLDESAQRCVAEAAAFLGDFHMGATAHVLSRPSAGNTQDVLRALVDKSFLRIRQDRRLALYDAVREFAIEVLPDLHREATDRLDAYLAVQAERDAGGVDALRRNVIAAAERAARGESALDANGRAWVLIQAGRLLQSEGPATRLSELMREGVGVIEEHADPELTARVRLAGASGLRMQGRLEEAEAEASALLDGADALPAQTRALVFNEVALSRHTRRDLEGASELYARALELCDSRRLEGRMHANLGAIAHDRGDLDTAESSYRDALSVLSVLGDSRLLGVVRSNLGLLYQERGDLTLAKDTLELALADLDEANEHYLGAIHLGNLAQLFLEMGELEQAATQQAFALSRLRRIGDQRSIAIALCRLAAAHALSGEVPVAQRELDEARGRARDLEDPLIGSVISLHQAFVPLARAEAVEPSDERHAQYTSQCRHVIHQVTGDVADVSSHGGGAAEDGNDEASSWRLSDDARAARRILEARLGAQSAAPYELPEDGLVVCIESRFFRLVDGEWQDLRRSTPARRILDSLVEVRKGLGIEDLQARVWPGERMRRDAAKNRIHVALSKLRKAGLKEWIQREDARYKLKPGLVVHRLARVQPEPDEHAL